MGRRRNRNYRKHTRTSPAPALVALGLLAVLGLAFGWLWLNTRCDLLAGRIKELEQQKNVLRRRVVSEELNWSNLTTYENMMKLLKQHGIEMDWPRERQIVRIRRAPNSGASDPAVARN